MSEHDDQAHIHFVLTQLHPGLRFGSIICQSGIQGGDLKSGQEIVLQFWLFVVQSVAKNVI